MLIRDLRAGDRIEIREEGDQAFLTAIVKEDPKIDPNLSNSLSWLYTTKGQYLVPLDQPIGERVRYLGSEKIVPFPGCDWPEQEGEALAPGHTKDPFAPLRGASLPADPLAQQLMFSAGAVEREDITVTLDWLIESLRLKMFSWYEIGLTAYRVKLARSWRGRFESFKDFCQDGLKKSVATINNWIRAARVLSTLLAEGWERLPGLNVAVELAKYDVAVMLDHWRNITDRWADHEITLERAKEMIADPLKANADPQFKAVRVPMEQWRQLQEVAADSGLSPTKLLEQFLKSMLGGNDDPEDHDGSEDGTGIPTPTPGGKVGGNFPPRSADRMVGQHDPRVKRGQGQGRFGENVAGGGKQWGDFPTPEGESDRGSLL